MAIGESQRSTNKKDKMPIGDHRNVFSAIRGSAVAMIIGVSLSGVTLAQAGESKPRGSFRYDVPGTSIVSTSSGGFIHCADGYESQQKRCAASKGTPVEVHLKQGSELAPNSQPPLEWAGIRASLTYTDDLSQFGVSWNSPTTASHSDDSPPGAVLPTFSGDEQIFSAIELGDSVTPSFPMAFDLHGVGADLVSADLYFDRNQNLDFTDDGPPIHLPAGVDCVIPTFNVPYSDGSTRPYSLAIYVYFASWDETYHISYFRQCAWRGAASIGSHLRQVFLLDDDTDGDYTSEAFDFSCVDIDGDGFPNGSSGGGELVRHFDPFLIGEQAYSVSDAAMDGTWVVFDETPTGSVDGSVDSTGTGLWLAGTLLEGWSGILVATETDGNGTFTLPVPEGSWTVRASRPGFIPSTASQVQVVGGEATLLDFSLTPIPVPCSGAVTLFSGQSYDFVTGVVGDYPFGGDLYVSINVDSAEFWANNLFQSGVLDLGDIGIVDLESVYPPDSGYYRFGVDIQVGHTYVSLAREGVHGYIIMRPTTLTSDSVTLEYYFFNVLVFESGFEMGVASDWSFVTD